MARIFQQIIGHELIRNRLVNSVTNKVKLSQASIFSGESSVGKKKFALALSQKLICKDHGCGECGACLRIEKMQSESLCLVEPESGQIKIERVREILRFLSLKGSVRVVIIDEAHLLNPQASNALLKTLEEPPEDTYIILITNSPYALLPTIRSRSQMIRFGRLSVEEMQTLFPSESEAVLVAAQGIPERVGLLSESEWSELRNKSFKFVCDAMGGQQPEIRSVSDSKSSALTALGIMQQILRDWWQLQFGDESQLLHHEFKAQIQNLPINLPLFRKLSMKLVDSELLIAQNIDRGLLFENIAVELRPSTA